MMNLLEAFVFSIFKQFTSLYDESVHDLEKTRTNGKDYLLSGHKNHVMVWSSTGRMITRIIFDQIVTFQKILNLMHKYIFLEII